MSRPSIRWAFAGLAALSLAFVVGVPRAADLLSYVFVNDDGSLRISGRTVHLYGIHIPDTERSCRTFTRPPLCGSRAALALDFKIGARFVRCEPESVNTDRSLNAVCWLDDEDLGAWLVSQGWAVAQPDAPLDYALRERIARRRGLGIWGFPADVFLR
jgi:endonuclease YncB( thermonuclease family)